jgi:hypothetical protein
VTLAARGLSNDEIAAQMVISPATAKTHISRAMTKLRARDRAQLVVWAYESAWSRRPPRGNPVAGRVQGGSSAQRPPLALRTDLA